MGLRLVVSVTSKSYPEALANLELAIEHLKELDKDSDNVEIRVSVDDDVTKET